MIIPTFFLAGGDKKKGQSGIPLLLMYGDHDWMGFPTANTFVSSLQKVRYAFIMLNDVKRIFRFHFECFVFLCNP
jgi:hypothetical protein